VSSTQQSIYVIYLPGGGQCFDEASCASRNASRKSSVNAPPSRYLGGVLDSDEEMTHLWGAHKASLLYCSSDGYMGNMGASSVSIYIFLVIYDRESCFLSLSVCLSVYVTNCLSIYSSLCIYIYIYMIEYMEHALQRSSVGAVLPSRPSSRPRDAPESNEDLPSGIFIGWERAHDHD
jgi:hypothetical protein